MRNKEKIPASLLNNLDNNPMCPIIHDGRALVEISDNGLLIYCTVCKTLSIIEQGMKAREQSIYNSIENDN